MLIFNNVFHFGKYVKNVMEENFDFSGLYGDSINEMSWLVSQTVATLKNHNLENNTLVLFLSDHGPEIELCREGGSTAGLRGMF